MSSGLRNVFVKNKMDWSTLIVFGKLLHWKKSRECCADDEIENAPRFIFLLENFQLLVWDSIRITKEVEMIAFQGVYRKISSENLWRRYCTEFMDWVAVDGKLLRQDNLLTIGQKFKMR